nr:hypothetical protein [Tanacetum cinerariifolium]
QRENDEFLKSVDENIKKIIKEQVKEQVKVQVSKTLPRIEQTVNEQLKAEVLTRSSHSLKTSYAVAVDLSGMELKKILIEKMEGNKCRDDDADKDEEPFAGPDRGSKRRREGKEPASASAPLEIATKSAGRSTKGSRSRQASVSESALAEKPVQTTFQMDEPSHLEFDTGADDQPIVQSSLHPEWFSQQQKPPTLDRDWNKTLTAVYGSIQPWISELAKKADSRSSFNELIDTLLDFSNFLTNRLKVDTLTPELLAGPTYELMKGSCKSMVELEYHLEEVFKATTDQLDWVNPEGASSHKYTTSIMKTKATDYEHIKWIEDLVPRTIWIEEPIGYDKHAFWGRRIIVVIELKIVEWHSYKHLDWITVRRDDDKLYKFKEGDFKRLRIQDIEDMLLLLVQGKLTNLTVEERFAFNNKDKKNRLMRIDELHKFSDGTLTDVRTALDDRLKGIWMRDYLVQQSPCLTWHKILSQFQQVVSELGKFEQWQFRIQQYLQHEHYALWEVIEFRDSYEVSTSTASTTTTDITSGGTGKKSGRTVTLIAEDMQKRKNDVKARTTLLLSLSDEHQLSNLDTMSLDDLYNHLKAYESEVHKKSEPNSQNMAFISSAKHSRGNEDVNIASVSTASINIPTIDEDDMEEMDIKWSMALLSMRADKFWKKTRKKISIQGSDVAGFDKSKVECFNYHKMGHFARECRAPRSQDRGRRDNYRQGSKVEEQAPKALMAIDRPTPMLKARYLTTLYALKTKLETLKKEKKGVDGKLASFLTASKDLDNLIESQRSDKNKEGLGYSAVPSPPAQIYTSLKKDLSWTGLLEFADDTAHSYLNRPFQRTSVVRSQFRAPWVPTANRNFPPGSSQNNINDKGYWDSDCSRHMTGNISYLSNYEPFDGGYVSFGQGGCKITGKGTIKTGKLKFENMYFVKDH